MYIYLEMEFELLRTIGNRHKVYSYDTAIHDFKGLLTKLFNTDDLYTLQNSCEEYIQFQQGKTESLQDIETTLHKQFYRFIKENDTFKTMYVSLIRDILDKLYPNEPGLIFQTFPSIRFQYTGNRSVPPHCDSDELGKHPIGEENFLFPITTMEKSNRLFIETEPNKKDYTGIDLTYGELLHFDGNKCVHYNEQNIENYARISFDFRVMTFKKYINYINDSEISKTNPRDPNKSREPIDIRVGGYYQCIFKNRPVVYHKHSDSILQTRPSFDDLEATSCYNYFKNGDPFLTEYKKTEELENSLKSRIGTKYCFMTPSGTSAIITALIACGICPGDEVIVPNYTMVATANAVKCLGAIPVVADVDSQTYTLNLDTIKQCITPRTKAIIHVSLNNRSTQLNDIVAYCKEQCIFLIEDAAQSLGCKLNGMHYGTFGDIGCFSLSSPKIITTGQGGFIITDNDSLAEKILKIKNFGRKTPGSEIYDSFGLNFKFTDIQSVIGLAQLSKLDSRILKMRDTHNQYFEKLKDLQNIKIIPPMNDEWIPWFVDIICKNRESISLFLSKHKIQTRITYPTINSILNGISNDMLDISSNGLFLPSHVLLKDTDISFICLLLGIIDAS
jgi:perosamine synthetase